MEKTELNEIIKEKLKQLPDKPGVYIMRDERETVLYVGKAKVLKNRVRQYFQSHKGHSLKIQRMVSKIWDFEYVITDTEVEALILEANLIKKHWPKYNTLLKDDKQYPYIKVVREKYPRIMKVRNIQKDKSKYFGPYTSGFAVNTMLDIIHERYPLRRCNLKLTGQKVLKRPCLNYYIHRCKAPCQGFITEEDYETLVSEAIKLIEGKEKHLRPLLEESMKQAAKELRYEDAAMYRDRLRSLDVFSEDQKVAGVKDEDYDMIGAAKYMEDACVEIFFIRGGRILGKEHFILNDVAEEKESKLTADFIQQFYGEGTFVPKQIYVQEGLEEGDLFGQWLSQKRGSKVLISVPLRGEKHQLMQMVRKNAFDKAFKHGEEAQKKNQDRNQALLELTQILGAQEVISRVEAFDISNTQGDEKVGAMVVFEEGKKKPSDYRRFKIKSIEGIDDYGSMREMLVRRFYHGMRDREAGIQTGFGLFPQVILIDGGKGHVKVVSEALSLMQLNLPVMGMVKDDRHRTRGLIFQGREYDLKKYPALFKWITKIQDETHRFAITYHRLLRSDKIFKSELEQIPGIGKERRKQLLLAFEDMDAIKNAPVAALCQVQGMNKRAAEKVYAYYHKEE